MVVRLAGQDLVTAVELLEQHHAGELVGQRELAEREPVVDVVTLKAERPADHEAQVAPALATVLQESAERDAVHPLAVAVQQRHERALRYPPRNLLVLADLDQLQPHMSRQQLLVMPHVIGEGRPQSSHGNDDDPHDVGYYGDMDDPNVPERHINLHFSPDIMAGVYANFANVSHSDYEFTVTFARVDHEVEEERDPRGRRLPAQRLARSSCAS